MQNHSPGPWEVWAGTIINDANGVLLGSVKEAAGNTLTVRTLEEARANARLIGAAPDLLAALIEAQGWLIKKKPADAFPLFENISAAISKATRVHPVPKLEPMATDGDHLPGSGWAHKDADGAFKMGE
jgi:hypothetical protein